MAEEAPWRYELDLIREQHDRDIDRVERSIQLCVTETFYAQAQKQTGERIGNVDLKVTRMEEREELEKSDRQKERNTNKAILIGAVVTLLSTWGLELLKLAAQ